MNVVFLGTGSFAVATLQRLLAEDSGSFRIAGVVTAPDRPRGRGRKVVAGEVASIARAGDLPLLQPANVNEPEALEWIAALEPRAIAVVDFGQKLGRALLDLPDLGCVNLHPSLLPRHRGASPVVYTVLAGDTFAGACIIRMIDRMDAGAVLARVATPVRQGETAGELADRLRPTGAALMAQTLRSMAEGDVVDEPQDDGQATLAPKLTPADRRLDWSRSAEEVSRRIRAMSPKPGVTVFFERAAQAGDGAAALRVILTRGDVAAPPGLSAPGQGTDPIQPTDPTPPTEPIPRTDPGCVVRVEADAIAVATGTVPIVLQALKPAGKGELRAADFARGYRVEVGDRFLTEEPAR